MATFIALATLALLTASVLFAGYQVREARLAREAQERPWVVVRLDMGWAIKLVVENTSAAVATDVHITFDPPLETSIDGRDIGRAPALRDGIPTLPPGERMAFFFDSVVSRLADECALPKVYRATMAYQDASRTKTFDGETYVLDIEAYRESLIEEEPLAKVAESLDKIRSSVSNVDRSIAAIERVARDRSKSDST